MDMDNVAMDWRIVQVSDCLRVLSGCLGLSDLLSTRLGLLLFESWAIVIPPLPAVG